MSEVKKTIDRWIMSDSKYNPLSWSNGYFYGVFFPIVLIASGFVIALILKGVGL